MSDNSFKFRGEITEIFDIKEGKSANGEWKALEFAVVERKEQYPQSCTFRLFGNEKVDNFMQYNKVGDYVDVSFNLKTNASKDGTRNFNSVDAWKIFKVKEQDTDKSPDSDDDDLPF